MAGDAFTMRCLRMPSPRGLFIRTFNIRNGQGFGLAQAIQEVHISGFNLMILTYTKVTYQAYCYNIMGYNVVCLLVITMDSGGAQGGVSLVVQDQPKGWIVESVQFHGPNVVICEVVASNKQTLLIGAYLPPSTIEHLPEL